MSPLPRTVDRRIAKAIAYKRIVTGIVALAGGVVMLGLIASHRGAPAVLVVLALATFFGGGAWTLWDGLRLRRELER